MKLQAVGLDPGFGNVKVATERSVVVMPSLVAVPRKVGLAASGLRVAKATIVRMQGQEYAVGSGAPLRGVAYESIDDMRFVTSPTIALMLGALAKALDGQGGQVGLMVGLPVSVLEGSGRSENVTRAARQRLLGCHTVEVDGIPMTLDIKRVWIRAQPLGVWADWAVTPDGSLLTGARKALVGIVDIGFNTVDLLGIEGGQAHLGMMAGADLGVRLLLEQAAGDQDLPYHELLRRYTEGTLTVGEEIVARWASEVASFIRRRWAGIRPSLTIMAGGGVALLRERGLLDQLRRAVRCDVHIPTDPIAAGARGLQKLGAALLARQQAQKDDFEHRQEEGADAQATVQEGAHQPAGDP